MIIYDYNEIKRLPESVARKGCFVKNMPNDIYHSFSGISKSGLDQIADSPAMYKDRSPYETTRAMVVGSALHAAILEPHVFEEQYHLLPEVKDRRAAEYKKVSEMYGKDNVLVKTECENLAAMTDQARRDKDVMAMLGKDGIAELSAFIECPETGVLLRCRYDYLIPSIDTCADLKKTKHAGSEDFSKSIGNFRYHVQDAMYSHIYKLLTGRDLTFKFIALQETAPHTARVYNLGEYSRMIGFHYFKKGLATYADCYSRDWWPHGGSNGEIELPYWVVNKYEEEVGLFQEFGEE
tara:strand:+ start:16874 stop:17755 length:882 start_codon:yes stop_codon:yes gene_type:complete